MDAATLTLGPVLFHWPAETKRDFYYRIADEAPVDTVYVGEVVCSKRAPFFEPYLADVAERLTKAGKTVVLSSLAEVMTARERTMTKELRAQDDYEVEANDAAVLFHLRGKPHRIGQYVNVYNEDTLAYLAARGAVHVALSSELPRQALAALGERAKRLGVGLEVQVYGRTGLALSARCYHARSHGRVKDNCRFVCGNDPDGMELATLDGEPFLAVNGIQTLSHTCLNLLHEVAEMRALGIAHLRLSPHSHDMVAVAEIFRAVLDGDCSAEEATAKLERAVPFKAFSRGFYRGAPGRAWNAA